VRRIDRIAFRLQSLLQETRQRQVVFDDKDSHLLFSENFGAVRPALGDCFKTFTTRVRTANLPGMVMLAVAACDGKINRELRRAGIPDPARSHFGLI
jgi:hypothetical protein